MVLKKKKVCIFTPRLGEREALELGRTGLYRIAPGYTALWVAPQGRSTRAARHAHTRRGSNHTQCKLAAVRARGRRAPREYPLACYTRGYRPPQLHRLGPAADLDGAALLLEVAPRLAPPHGLAPHRLALPRDGGPLPLGGRDLG